MLYLGIIDLNRTVSKNIYENDFMHSRREATRSQQTTNDPLILLLVILELKLKAAKVYMTDMDITFSKLILYFKVLLHSYISFAHYDFNHISMIETHVKCDNIYLSVTMYNTQW